MKRDTRNGHPVVSGFVQVLAEDHAGKTEVVYGRPNFELDGEGTVRCVAGAIRMLYSYREQLDAEGYRSLRLIYFPTGLVGGKDAGEDCTPIELLAFDLEDRPGEMCLAMLAFDQLVEPSKVSVEDIDGTQ